jgi:hypothetical protein
MRLFSPCHVLWIGVAVLVGKRNKITFGEIYSQAPTAGLVVALFVDCGKCLNCGRVCLGGALVEVAVSSALGSRIPVCGCNCYCAFQRESLPSQSLSGLTCCVWIGAHSSLPHMHSYFYSLATGSSVRL